MKRRESFRVTEAFSKISGQKDYFSFKTFKKQLKHLKTID